VKLTYERLGWHFIEARDFVKKAEVYAAASGLHLGICGSILHTGYSQDDLDLVVFPLQTKKGFNFRQFQEDLETLGCFDWKNCMPYHADDTKVVFSCFYNFKQRIDWFIFDIGLDEVRETI
jgi:hypothetical protein